MTAPGCDCQEILDQLDAFHRGELDAAATEALRLHLAACRHCDDIARHEAAFLARLHAMRREPCPEPLRDRVRRQCAEPPRDG